MVEPYGEPTVGRCGSEPRHIIYPEEIEREANALVEQCWVDAVCRLLDTLPPAGTDVSDEEVAKREAELCEGTVQELPQDEFVRRAENERGK